MLTSLAYAVLQLIFDGAYAWSWQAIIGDYLVAFTALGLGGLCWKMKGGFYWGALLGTLARFVSNYLTREGMNLPLDALTIEECAQALYHAVRQSGTARLLGGEDIGSNH